MALSMDEQRMLAEIERRLAAEDPGLATRLSSFRRPGPAARLRTTRGAIIGSIAAIALLAIIAVTVYATIPFRANGQKLTKQPATTSTSAPAKTSAAKTSAAKTSAAKTSAANTSAANTSTVRKSSPNSFAAAP